MAGAGVQQLIVYCEGCKANVSVEIVIHVPLEVSALHMKKLRCPVCGTGAKGLKL